MQGTKSTLQFTALSVESSVVVHARWKTRVVARLGGTLGFCNALAICDPKEPDRDQEGTLYAPICVNTECWNLRAAKKNIGKRG